MRISDWSSDVCSSDLVPSAKSVIRNRTNASRKKYRDRSLPPGKQGKKMLCDERGPDAVNSKNLGHHRCFKLPEAFFRTDVSPAMQQPRRHYQRSEARRVVKDCVSPCSSRWSRYHLIKKHSA